MTIKTFKTLKVLLDYLSVNKTYKTNKTLFYIVTNLWIRHGEIFIRKKKKDFINHLSLLIDTFNNSDINNPLEVVFVVLLDLEEVY